MSSSSSLLEYSQAHKAVLSLQDQKQLVFEELSEYLATVTADRERLATMIAGHATSSGLGIGAYLRDKVDALRGSDEAMVLKIGAYLRDKVDALRGSDEAMVLMPIRADGSQAQAHD